MLFDTIEQVNDDKQLAQARIQDEESTQRRAAILGLPYLDTRDIEASINLLDDVLSIEDMHKNRIVPLVAGGDSTSWQFGITTQTPQSLLKELADK